MQSTIHRLVDVSSGAALGRLAGLTTNTPSASSHGVPRRQNISCRVFVSVMVNFALRAIPGTNRQRQFFNDVSAGRASFARRKEAVNLLQFLTVSIALVRNHADKVPERRIRQRSRQAVIADHAPDIEVFHAQYVETTNQVCCDFVQVIATRIMDTCVNFCDMLLRAFPTLTTFLTSCQYALSPGKLFLEMRAVFGVGNALAVTESSKARNAKVYAYGFMGFGPLFEGLVETKCYEVASGSVLGYRHCRRLASKIPTPYNLQFSKLGESQCFGFGVPLESRTGVLGSLFAVLALKGRIGRTLLEKVSECRLKVPQRLLGRNTGNVIQPSVVRRFFERCQRSRTGVVVDGLARFVSVASEPQCEIINITASAKSACKVLLLRRRRVETKFKSNLHKRTVASCDGFVKDHLEASASSAN